MGKHNFYLFFSNILFSCENLNGGGGGGTWGSYLILQIMPLRPIVASQSAALLMPFIVPTGVDTPPPPFHLVVVVSTVVVVVFPEQHLQVGCTPPPQSLVPFHPLLFIHCDIHSSIYLGGGALVTFHQLCFLGAVADDPLCTLKGSFLLSLFFKFIYYHYHRLPLFLHSFFPFLLPFSFRFQSSWGVWGSTSEVTCLNCPPCNPHKQPHSSPPTPHPLTPPFFVLMSFV